MRVSTDPLSALPATHLSSPRLATVGPRAALPAGERHEVLLAHSARCWRGDVHEVPGDRRVDALGQE